MESLFVYATLGIFFVLGTLFVLARHRRQTRDTLRLAKSREEGLHIPATLHPVIDPDICIGSLSCVSACPEGDILGIVQGSATLVSGSSCIGHGRCAAECPVDAIKLVFGTSERGVDLPEVDEMFESSRPGVFIVGELSGMGLIKNAMTQGLELGEFLARSEDKGGSTLDAVIVGAGPAGLATGLALRAAGMSFEILEQDTLGGTVAAYPRQKVVMTEQILLPIFGKFGRSKISKEELVTSFEAMRDKGKLPIRTGVKVTGLEGNSGQFVVKTTTGDVQAKRVVLATGRRGSPRKLGAPGEESPHVTYRLIDPEQYGGSNVLVVGGGDSALEAALSLMDAGAKVSLSYRGPTFSKCRAENRESAQRAIEQGRIKAHFVSEVSQISPGKTLLKIGDSTIDVPADYVVVLIGGELPKAFLDTLGIKVKRFHGEERAQKKAVPNKAGGIGRKSQSRAAKQTSPWFGWSLFGLGLATLAVLSYVGGDYYLLDAEARIAHPEHAFLRSSGLWGHGVGIAATLFMLSNFLYALRKRWSRLRSWGRIRSWLTFHVFVGTMSPLVIAFHAAFESKNQLATATAISLAIVAVTGLIGRYLYGLVPSREGKLVELDELRARFEILRAQVPEETLRALGTFSERLTGNPPRSRALIELLRLPFDSLMLEWSRVRNSSVDPDVWESLREAHELRVSIAFARGLRKILASWRVLHVMLAIFLVFAISVHVVVSIYFGYAWIWSE